MIEEMARDATVYSQLRQFAVVLSGAEPESNAPAVRVVLEKERR